MKRALPFLILAMPLLGAAGPIDQLGGDLEATLNKFLAQQTNCQTWTAELTQVRLLKSLVQPLVSTGRVWFATPNQFRWELGQPAQTIAVRNKDAMLVIYPRLNRAEKYSFGASKSARLKDSLALIEAGFPTSRAGLEQQFKIIPLSPTNSSQGLALQPKSSQARRAVSQVDLLISTNTYALLGTTLHFGDGSTMMNLFTNAQSNSTLPANIFTPTLGPDLKITEPLR